jgi:hypothetical protein
MNGRASALALAVLLVLAAGLFVERAAVNGRLVNTNINRTDQGAYIKQAIDMRMTDYAVVSPRNRMPAYPWILSLFLDKEEITAAGIGHPPREAKNQAAAEFFPTGKAINIALALATAVVFGGVAFVAFPRHHAANLTVFAAFTVLIFKAPYVQAEILYYLLTFLVFVLCWRLFGRPRWWLAVLAGAVLGLAHLTKASVLPGLLVVAVFLPLDAFWLRWRSGRPALGKILATALVVGAFLATVYPYIAKSKELFGRYFYNVNSTFYIWTDSWEEAKARTRAAGDRRGWPDLPPEELPSLQNYLRTHSPGQIVWRVVKGVSVVVNEMAGSYGYFGPGLAYLLAAVGVVGCKRRLAWRMVRARPFPPLALAAYFVGYFLLVAWYSPIIDGNRFILGLFLPFLFTVSAVLVTFGPRVRWTWRGRTVTALGALNAVLSVWIAVEVFLVCVFRIPEMYGGS